MHLWLRQLSRLFTRSRKASRTLAHRHRRPRALLRVESLEGREVPAVQLINCPFASLLPMVTDDALIAGVVERVCGGLPTVTANLSAADDTGVAGDRRTSEAFVTLTGQTSPNAIVSVLGTGASGRADAAGRFNIEDVPLASGLNDLTIRTTDRGGNINQVVQTFTRFSAPTATGIPDQSAAVDAAPTQLNLAGFFADADILNTIVRMTTIRGDVDAELFDDLTPLHAANFLTYVTGNDYDGTIFHRSVPGFVIQAGGFRFDEATRTLPGIRQGPTVQNEPGISNLRGTIALAKVGGDPSSGTNQFFFNLANNSANLDNQNGGFTAFGQVLGDGMTVVDQLASIPTQDRPSPFDDIPLVNFPTTATFPGGLSADNLVTLNDVTVRRQRDALTFSVTSNTNPALVNAVVNSNTLTLNYQAGQMGIAQITIRATDRDGLTVDTTFTVTVQ